MKGYTSMLWLALIATSAFTLAAQVAPKPVLAIGGPGGGGSGSGAAAYEADFTGQTTITVTAVAHGHGTTPYLQGCWDDATPKNLIAQSAGYPTVAANGDMVMAWSGSKNGACYISSGTGATGAAGETGPTGPQGIGWIVVATAPDDSEGVDGEMAFRTDIACIYGPKAAGAWPTDCTSVTNIVAGSRIVITNGNEPNVDDATTPYYLVFASSDPGSTTCPTLNSLALRQDNGKLWYCSALPNTWTLLLRPGDVVVKKGFGATFFKSDGSTLSTATSFATSIPTACALAAWTISADAGTATFKVWKKATGTAIPTISDVINTSGVSLSTGTHVRSTTLTDFTDTTWDAGDQIIFALTAVSGAAWVTVRVECQE